MKTHPLALALAIVASQRVASATPTLFWQAPDACPTESQVRTWLADEMRPTRTLSPTRVMASVSQSAEGWSALLRTRRGEVEALRTVRGPDCETLARLVVQEVVFDVAVLPDASATPTLPPVAFVTEAPYAAPSLASQPADAALAPPRASVVGEPRRSPDETQRFSLDLGGGVGLAFLSGALTYAEAFSVAGTAQVNCGAYTCYRNVAPGFATTYYGYAALRFHPARRIALGLTARLQADAAGWTVSGPSGLAAEKSNPFANLLLTARVYYALPSRGFVMRGLTTSLFAGVGVGQIEPRPNTPPNARAESAHVVSGYFETHVGVRVEYAFATNLHVGAELTAHLLFPETLFNVDATLFTGVHL